MDRHAKTEVEIHEEPPNEPSSATGVLAYLMEPRRRVFRVGRSFWSGDTNCGHVPIHPIFTVQEP
jgi:hypothetical protein